MKKGHKVEHVSPRSLLGILAEKSVRPLRFNYVQTKKPKVCDVLEVLDSVATLLFNVTRNELIFVKQFRPIYFKPPSQQDIITQERRKGHGFTIELCTGVVDKAAPLENIAVEAILDETGYMVKPENLEPIMSYRSGVAVQAAKQSLFFCEVSDEMKYSEGGGYSNDMIEVVTMSIDEAEEFVVCPPAQPVACPPSGLFAIMWFIHNKARKYRTEPHVEELHRQRSVISCIELIQRHQSSMLMKSHLSFSHLR